MQQTAIQAAIAHFEALQKRYTKQHNGTACEHVKMALEGLKRMEQEPEVVRCIQCLNSKPVPPEKSWHIDTGDYRVCACERGLHDITSGLSLVGPDWYCDDGERKEGT